MSRRREAKKVDAATLKLFKGALRKALEHNALPFNISLVRNDAAAGLHVTSRLSDRGGRPGCHFFLQTCLLAEMYYSLVRTMLGGRTGERLHEEGGAHVASAGAVELHLPGVHEEDGGRGVPFPCLVRILVGGLLASMLTCCSCMSPAACRSVSLTRACCADR